MILSILLATLVECEQFTNYGGWVVDSQFIDEMGSSYLLAHGLGRKVADATTSFQIEREGVYTAWVRTKNWTAKWSTADGAGAFQLIVNGKILSKRLGCEGNSEWRWVKAGEVSLKAGENTLALHDLTGFDGRCDAIEFTLGEQPVDNGRLLTTAPVIINSDLTVVGGGIAGICTAISAARLGLKVALIQDRPILGGANSSEVRVHLGGYQNLNPYPRLGDIVSEIGPKHGGNARTAANYEDDRKLAAVKAEKNISLFLNTRVVKVNGKSTRAESAERISTVIGRNVITGVETAFASPLFADCTGDGTIGYLAGADYRLGRESRAETGEDMAPEKADRMTMGASVQWYAEKKVGEVFPHCDWMIAFNETNCEYNLRGDWDWETGMNRDQLNDFETVRDYGLLVVYSNWSFIKNFGARKAEFADASLSWVAHIAGKRETRRLMGDHILCQQDIFEERPYPDGTCCTTWAIDLHYPMPANQRNFEGEPFRSVCTHNQHYAYPIPYRCFYSRNVENLFMAGRDISVTHVALGTTRVMRTHGMQGEVVGMAASICKARHCLPRAVYESYLDDLKSLMTKGVGLGEYQPPQNYNRGALKQKQVEVRVKKTVGGPQIFVEGKPTPPHMFWGWNSSIKRPVSTEWKKFDIAFTPRVNLREAQVRFRIQEEAGLVQLRGCEFVGEQVAHQLKMDFSKTPKQQAFVSTDKNGVTTIDLRSYNGREHELPALDFCQRTTTASLKAGETYHLRFEARAEGIEWIRSCIHQNEQGPYNYWVMEVPPDDRRELVNWQQAHKAAQAGVNFVTFFAPCCWQPETEMKEALAALDSDMETYIDANPNVLLIPRITLNVQSWWANTHSGECMVKENGRRNGYPSVSSKVYRDEAVTYVRRVVRHLMKKFPRHLAGVQFTGQNTNEWFYEGSWTNLCGYDEPTLSAWRDWLAKKGDPNAATATVPTPAERRAARMPMRLWDPIKDKRMLEFNRFLQDEMVDLVTIINKACREETEGKKMVFSFYGYGWEFASVVAGPAATGHYGLWRLLQKGGDYIDVMASPYCYDRRGRGWIGSSPVMPAAETITAHGILWVNEDDSRTWLNHSRVGNCGIVKTENLAQTIELLKRNTAANAVRGQGSWWMDLVGNGWFDDERLWQVIPAFKNQDEQMLTRKRIFTPDVACIMDEESMLNLSYRGSRLSLLLMKDTRLELPYIGASYGQFLFADALSRDLGAKLELYLACWCMSDEQAATVASWRQLRPNVTRVWGWASGYSAPTGFSTERMSKVIGFKVKELPAAESSIIATAEGLKSGLPAKWAFAKIKGDDKGIMPCFSVDALPEETLATWPDGSAAIAKRKNPYGLGWDVFVGVPLLPRPFLRTLAEISGAHLWYDRDHIKDFTLNASDELVWIQAHTNVNCNLNFPNGKQVELKLKTGDVKTFNYQTKDTVVIVPAHPDDLIACLGFCHLARDKYDIHVVDVTHGERGLGPKGLVDGSTKKIRTQEEEAVCKSIGATLHWLDEVDGEAYATRDTCHKLAQLLVALNPRAIIAHWPVDVHTDHVMSGAIALRAAFLAKLSPEIYFMEQTYQSKRFVPDIVVDFSSVYDKVWESLRLYKCQYRDGGMERRRRTAADFYGQHSLLFNRAKCEGYMAFAPFMQGQTTIFSDLPHPNGGQKIVFQGVRK